MKFDLKNRPDMHTIKQWIEVKEWFEGFEKELREMRTAGVYESHFDRRLIEEILGSEGPTEDSRVPPQGAGERAKSSTQSSAYS